MKHFPALVPLALVALAFIAACQGPGDFRKPSTALERGLYFSEVDHEGHQHGISEKTHLLNVGEPAVARVAWGLDVDVASQIPIRLLRDQLGAATSAPAMPAALDALPARAERVQKLLDAFSAYLTARADTIAKWQALRALPEETREDSEQDEAFRASRNELNAGWQALSAQIEALWPKTGATAARFEQIDELLTRWREENDGSAFQAFLQSEIDALQSTAEASLDAVEARATRLRIEAFLIPSEDGKDPVAIHVEGYDKIDSKRVEGIDRMGLRLTERERKALDDALAAVRETAAAAERVRKGEATLAEAFRDVRSAQVSKLSRALDELEGLKAAWEETGARVARTQAAVDEFATTLKTRVEERIPAERAALESSLREGVGAFMAETQGMEALLALIADVRAARELWEGASLADLPEAYALATRLAGEAREVYESRDELLDGVQKLGDDTLARIRAWASAEATGVKELALTTYDESALKVELVGWQRLIRRTTDAAKTVANVAGTLSGLKKLEPLPASTRVPEPLDPLLEDARDTFIDLANVDRKAGDRVEVRASLLDDGEPRETSSFSFDVKKLGWHGDPVPAIVLVTADKLAGADDSGGFSASLSWMLRYGPRNDETNFLAKSARALGWGIGPHATLLNFDPDNDAEIGLGLTIGFWDDLLLFGAGVNALAEDSDDGQVYYFIGSSLIPLLQAME